MSHETPTRFTAELPLDEVSFAEFEIIRAALRNPFYRFRTVDGISLETELDPEKVATVLANGEIARETPFKDKDGNYIFAPVEQKKTIKEKLEAVRLMLAN
jgi:hypothetical protein